MGAHTEDLRRAVWRARGPASGPETSAWTRVFGKNAQASRKRRRRAKRTSVPPEFEADADAEVDADDARRDVAASKRACMTGVKGVADGWARTKDWMRDESVRVSIAWATNASRSAEGVRLSAIVVVGEGTCTGTGRAV